MKLRRWSLRAGLLLVDLTAVVLGALASIRARALARREAIESVDRLHGTYGYRLVGST